MGEVKYYLNKGKGSKKSRPIMLSYHFNNQRLFYYTGKRIAESHFNRLSKESPAKSGCTDQLVINQTLKELRNMVGLVENEFRGKVLTPDILRERLNDLYKTKTEIKDEHKVTLTQYIDIYINGLSFKTNKLTGHKLSKAMPLKYGTIKKLFIDFCRHEGREYDFHDIDRNFSDRFVAYMLDEKKYAVNTYGRSVKFFKTILNEATKDGYNTSTAYKNVLVGVTEESDSIYLNEDELQKIYEKDLSDRPGLVRVRDVFLIGCWTGMRFGDYTTINPSDIQGDRIRITAHKTKQKIVIPVHPVVQAILTKYNFQLPKAISNQKFNEALKDIAKLAEIDEIQVQRITKGGETVETICPKYELVTSHVARRSFATNAYRRGVDPVLIRAITGHKSESEFLKYIKIKAEEKADMFANSVKW
jgi:integrase